MDPGAGLAFVCRTSTCGCCCGRTLSEEDDDESLFRLTAGGSPPSRFKSDDVHVWTGGGGDWYLVTGVSSARLPSGRRVVGREQIAHLALGLSLSALGFDWAATADEDDDEDDDNVPGR